MMEKLNSDPTVDFVGNTDVSLYSIHTSIDNKVGSATVQAGEPINESSTIIIVDFGSSEHIETLPTTSTTSPPRKSSFDFSFTLKKKYLRYIHLSIYLISLLIASGTYAGWTFFASMLEFHNVYSWLCKDSSESSGCPAQKQSIQSIYTFALAGNYFCNIIAGFCRDSVGPKVTSLIGLLLLTTGYLLAAFSGEHFDFYILAFFLIGSCSDFFYYSSFSLMALFPTIKTAVSGVLLGAGCLSWYVPAIQFNVGIFYNLDLKTIFIGYLLIALPFCLLFSLFLPWSNYKFDIKSSINENKTQEYTVLARAPEVRHYTNSTSKKKELNHNEYSEIDSNLKLQKFDSPALKPTRIDTSVISSNNDIQPGPESYPYAKEYYFNVPQKKSNVHNRIGRYLKFIRSHPVFDATFSLKHYLNLLFFAICTFRYVLYLTTLSEFLGPDYALILGYIVPLSCFATPIYGYFIDKFGFRKSAFIYNTLNLIMTASSILAIIFQNKFLNWMSIILAPPAYGSYLLLYGYTTMKWGHLPNYLTLVGIDLIIATFASFSTTIVYKLSLNLFDGNFIPALSFVLIVTFLSFPIIHFLDK